MVEKIISGGQTGVDQAALDVAIDLGIEHGGWIPAGRKTEDGPLPDKYLLEEMESDSYPDRTRRNVVEADATLIISHGKLTGGSALTARIAEQYGRPMLHVDLEELGMPAAAVAVKRWLDTHSPGTLNVAGPRASSDRIIHGAAYALLVSVLKDKQMGSSGKTSD